MIPILYDNTYASVTDDDAVIGYLADCISCEVTEERNGAYTAELVYPVGGIHFHELKPTRIIRLRANHSEGFDRYQLFRIWRISRPMDKNGEIVCTFYLRHISYDLDGVIVMPGEYYGSAQEVMRDAISRSTDPDTPFDFESDIPAVRAVQISLASPVSFRSFIGGMDGSVLAQAGGEFEFDNFTVRLNSSRVIQSYVQVRYGKNIIELNDDVDASNTYTHVLPFAYRTEDGVTDIVYKFGPDKRIAVPDVYDIGRDRVLPIDLTSLFSDPAQISMAAVESAGNAYIENHGVGNVIQTINCKFADLRAFETYKNLPMEDVSLCAYADVYFEPLAIHATMQITRTVYDVLGEAYTDLTLGEKTASFVDKFASVSRRTNVLKSQVDVLMQRT